MMKDFDKLIAVAQDLRNEVAQEYEEEIKELKNEISSLKNFKNEKIKYEKEINELQEQLAKTEEKYRTRQVKKVLGEYVTTAFRVKRTYVPKPKCDKCDSKRQIHFKSPLGTDFVENCPCSMPNIIYDIYSVHLIDFTVFNNDRLDCYYELDETNSSYDHYDRLGKIIRSEEDIPDYFDFRNTFFDKELCKKYCDELNKGVAENDRRTT